MASQKDTVFAYQESQPSQQPAKPQRFIHLFKPCIKAFIYSFKVFIAKFYRYETRR